MTRAQRLELLKQIEKDIHVCSLESTLLDDAKSCAIHSAIEELEQEPTTKNDLGVDYISRKALYSALYDRFHDEDANNITDVKLGVVRDFVKNFPSVTPQEPKTGHWLMPDKEYSSKIWRKCSCCGTHIEKYSKYISFDGEVHYIPYRLNYCYICGAKMVETIFVDMAESEQKGNEEKGQTWNK